MQTTTRINEPTWIAAKPRKHAVFELLCSFITNAVANPANVQAVLASTLIKLQSAGTQGPSADQYNDELYVSCGILLTIVSQLSAGGPEQEVLVDLLVKIRNTSLPPSVQETVDEYDPYNEFHLELTPFIRAWSDFEHDAPLYPPLAERRGMSDHLPRERPPWRRQPGNYLTAPEWTNLNAFTARLHVRVPEVVKLDLRGLFAMIEALETPLTPAQLRDNVPAAAAWIVVAGEQLKNNDFPYAKYPSDDGTRRLPWSRGELWEGPLGFGAERWAFWMGRFRRIEEMEGVGEEVREACRRALGVAEAL
ncbi:Protein of unknown function (DUF3632) [Teratosphaeria destructans]|uniref:Uncharacterized protein n=1 Tax=Teratosphaeria destructans TaxID=418781 RepID=A0A9W7STB7_9PEZI|nr:Protein of unknown function (DUF3632) [Teratosphaeria destructans]